MAGGEKKAAKKGVAKYVAKRNCPKCGLGVRLAMHGNRASCGRCGYKEMK